MPWQWQLTGRIDLSVPAKVYDIDGDTQSARTVRRLHARGRKVVCYISAGTWEEFRRDADTIPPEVRGEPLGAFPDERWLDIRRIDLLEPVLRRRMETCRRKGFDAVEPDNVDGYSNRSGFPLTADDQLRFNVFVANLAHSLGLSVALKNDTAQVSTLVPYFDFAIVESCFRFDECGAYRPFVRAGKAVFVTEYEVPPRRFCAKARRLRFSAIFKRTELGVFRRAC